MSEGASLSDMVIAIAGVAKPVVETGCQLLDRLFGKPCEVAGNRVADQIYGWQWANRVRMAARAKVHIEGKGIAPRVLPPGFLIPLVEAAGNIDDPELQDLWARLLASGVESDNCQHPAFVRVLQQISPKEATLLNLIARSCFRFQEDFDVDSISKFLRRRPSTGADFPLNRLSRSEDDLRFYLSHLFSLGLIVFSHETDIVWNENSPVKRRKLGERRFTFAQTTNFGRHFLTACCDTTHMLDLPPKESWELTEHAIERDQHALDSAEDALSNLSDLESHLDDARDDIEEAKSQSEEAVSVTRRIKTADL
jgi:hypothetical protein